MNQPLTTAPGTPTGSSTIVLLAIGTCAAHFPLILAGNAVQPQTGSINSHLQTPFP